MEHATDGWPIGQLAKSHGTAHNALHRREKELMVLFREYLEDRGICCSLDVFANDTEKMTSVVLVPLFIELGIGKQNDRPVKED